MEERFKNDGMTFQEGCGCTGIGLAAQKAVSWGTLAPDREARFSSLEYIGVGSNPTKDSINKTQRGIAQLVERCFCKADVRSSILLDSTRVGSGVRFPPCANWREYA